MIVGGAESSPHTLVVQYLHFESEVLLQVLDDHDQERKLDGQGLLWVKWRVNVVSRHIRSHDFENRRLNIWIRDSLDVTISDTFVPNLQWFRSKSKK